MSDNQIIIEDYQLLASVGVYEQEKRARQLIRVDLTLDCDFQKAIMTDDLCNTIDYDKVIQLISDVVKEQHFHLLETLAEAIAQKLMQSFDIIALSLCLSKPHINENVAKLAIRIQRRRDSKL